MWWKLSLFVILSFIIGSRVAKFIYFLGYHKMVYNHAPGPCQLVKGVDVGAEDIQLIYGSLALMTTGLRTLDGYHSTDPFWTSRKGDMKLFDFDHPEEGAKSVEIQGNLNTDTLNPHGLSIWNDQDSGRIFVFVVNHKPELKEAIERFEFFPKTRVLKHLETITDVGHMFMMNDVVAVGPESFYFTNSVYNSGEWLLQLELYSMVEWGNVVYYDGSTKKMRVVVDSLHIPNGIVVSPNGKVLYVALYGERSIRSYTINKNHSLLPLQHLPIYTSPDNIDIRDNYLISTAHPSFHKFAEHVASHLTTPSPSQVLKINIKDDGHLENLTEIYADDGTTFSCSTVAVNYKGKQLLMGSVYGKAMYCEVTTIGLF